MRIIKINKKDISGYAIQKKKWFKKSYFCEGYNRFVLPSAKKVVLYLPSEPYFTQNMENVAIYADINDAIKQLEDIKDYYNNPIKIIHLDKLEEELIK